MRARASALVGALWAFGIGSVSAGVVTVEDDVALRRALRGAGPGDTVLVAPGVYRGGLEWSPRGEPGRPVALAAADPDDPPVFRGGFEGIKLTRPAHAVLRDLIFEGAKDNGLNADDGGRAGDPAGPLELRRVVVRAAGRAGNEDGFKLSGVDGLKMIDCVADRWGGGGRGIDLVGCHRAVVRGCRVDGGGKSKVGLQAKGGSRDVLFETCRVEGVTERCVNIGGLTGEKFFRPADANAEATDVRAVDCELVGAGAAVAFVGSDGGRVEGCVLYRQKRYPIRILRENNADRLVPTRGGSFVGNTVVWHDGDLLAFVNVGANTAAETFRFAGNVWYCATHPARSTPAGLPATETGGVYGVDPELKDPPEDLTPAKTPPILRREAGRSARLEARLWLVGGAAAVAVTFLALVRWLPRVAGPAKALTGPTRFARPPPQPIHAVLAGTLWAAIMVAASLTPFLPNGRLAFMEILREFAALPLDAVRFSGGDFLGNAVAGIPLGVLWTAAACLLRRPGRRGWRAAAVGFAFACAAGLAVTAASSGFAFLLESSQLLFRFRIPSKYDVVAQTIGAAAGAVLWIVFGRPASAWAARRRWGEVRRAQPIDFCLTAILALVVLWSLRPYDFLVHPPALARQLREPWFFLIPFRSGGGIPDFCWSFVRGTPVGLAAAIFRTPPDRSVRRWPVAAAGGTVWVCGLEAAQIFVRGRVFDSTDLVAGSAGVAFGAGLAFKLARNPVLTPVPMAGRRLNTVRRSVAVGLTAAAAIIYARATGWFV